MKILIVYASKWGASKEAAEMLAGRLNSSCEVTVKDINDAPPTPEGFDVAVVGGSVRIQRLNKKLKRYIRDNGERLSAMQSAAFICCGYEKNFEEYVTMQIPSNIHFSLGVHCFGGELKPDKVKGFDKFVVKAVREGILTQDPNKSDCDRHELPELAVDTIYALAERINNLK